MPEYLRSMNLSNAKVLGLEKHFGDFITYRYVVGVVKSLLSFHIILYNAISSRRRTKLPPEVSATQNNADENILTSPIR